VILEIKDNGRGIPEELLRHFRATGAGTGVGIAGIRERVRELGGKLTLESNSNGTLVRVGVPLDPAVHREQQV
ncbi:MAG: ATP-binding protein, partial [Bryobacteraceae bacterium]